TACSSKLSIVPPRGLRVRLAAALIVVAYAAELANEDTRWVETHPDLRFIAPGWSGRPKKKPRIEVHSPARRLSRLLQSWSSQALFASGELPYESPTRKVAAGRSV